jgi:hypothetical protein
MKLYPISFLLVTMALTACNRSGGSSGSGGPGFTQNMRGEAMAAPHLTADEKAKYGNLFKNQALLSPDPDLYFSNDSSNNQKKINKLNSVGKTFLAKVKASCKIDPGTDSKSGSSELGQTEITKRSKSISDATGSTCPISYVSSETNKQTTTALDLKAGVFSAQINSDSSTSSTVLDQDMKAQLAIVATTEDSHAETSINSVRPNGSGNLNSGSIYSKSIGHVSMLMSNGAKMTGVTKMEMVAVSGHRNVQMVFTLNLPDGNAIVLGVFANDQAKEFVLNGEAYTAERIKQEFGIDMDI